MYKGSTSVTSLSILGVIYLFNKGHLNRYKVTSHGGSDLHFPDQWYWAPSRIFLANYIFLRKMFYSSFLPIFNWVIYVIILRDMCSLHIHMLGNSITYMVDKNIFPCYIGNFLLLNTNFLCSSTFFVLVLCTLSVTGKEFTDNSFYPILLRLLAAGLTFRSLIHFELVFM